jgi:hypothetical protein
MRAATGGRAVCLPLRFARSRRGPWLGAHVPTGRRVEDSRTRHQRSDTLSLVLAEPAGHPPRLIAHLTRLAVGSRIAPLAIMEKCGPARHASRAPLASQAIEQARPLTPTDPNLRSAAIGRCGRTARTLDT